MIAGGVNFIIFFWIIAQSIYLTNDINDQSRVQGLLSLQQDIRLKQGHDYAHAGKNFFCRQISLILHFILCFLYENKIQIVHCSVHLNIQFICTELWYMFTYKNSCFGFSYRTQTGNSWNWYVCSVYKVGISGCRAEIIWRQRISEIWRGNRCWAGSRK